MKKNTIWICSTLIKINKKNKIKITTNKSNVCFEKKKEKKKKKRWKEKKKKRYFV